MAMNTPTVRALHYGRVESKGNTLIPSVPVYLEKR